MKKFNLTAIHGIALMLGTVVTLSSCSEEVMNPENETAYAPVCVQVNEFSVSMTDFPTTRAVKSAAEYADVKAITLALYDSQGTEVYNTTQLRDDASTYTTFGQFSFGLPVGNYTLVAVGRNHFSADVFTLTSPTEAAYTSNLPRETFCTTQSVTISGTTPLDLSITLNRINTMLIVRSTDLCPVDAAKLRTTYAEASKGFNPTTGLATDDDGFTIVNNMKTENNKTNNSSYAFLSTDEQSMDITLEVLDASDNVLCTKSISDVPFKRNRATILEGQLFTPSSASNATISFEAGWLQNYTVTF